jgi:CheY-like chemotaxis protein
MRGRPPAYARAAHRVKTRRRYFRALPAGAVLTICKGLKHQLKMEPLGALMLYRVMEQTIASQTVLVVEDEAIIRMSTAVALEDAGFHVLEACNSAEALEILALYSDIAAVVTDVRMPGGMDGLCLVAQMKREYPHIRTLVVSGNTAASDAYDAGATAFIGKPYEPLGVVETMRKFSRAA